MKSFKFFTKNNDFTELDRMVIEAAVYLNDTNQRIIGRDVFLDIGYMIRIESCGYSRNGWDEVHFTYHYRDESVVMLTQRRSFTLSTNEYMRIVNEYRQNATI